LVETDLRGRLGGVIMGEMHGGLLRNGAGAAPGAPALASVTNEELS